jgi:hypothetical protein
VAFEGDAAARRSELSSRAGSGGSSTVVAGGPAVTPDYDVKDPFLALNNEAISRGIGIVAPGQKIKETLTVALDRKKKRNRESEPTVAMPDSAWKPSDGDYARADFLADLFGGHET